MRSPDSLSLLAAGAFLVAVPVGATPPTIVAKDGLIRLSDLVSVTDDRAGSLIVARLPRNAGPAEWSEATRRRLVKNRVPGLTLQLRHDGPVLVVVVAGEQPLHHGACFTAITDIEAGRHIVVADVSASACNGEIPAAGLGYDRDLGAPMARGTIDAGAYLGAIRPLSAEPAVAGQELTLRVADGPIIVERTVVAAQGARGGDNIFVRTKDGELLSQPLILSREEGTR